MISIPGYGRNTITPRPNVGYYGRLLHVVNDELVTLYATPELPHTDGLFTMAKHIEQLARTMNADAYQLRRNLGGHDRAQGCVMCLNHEAALADRRVRL